MAQCFVIQPFDKGGKFDKRYDDVFAPAIINAGLEPYRVDRDPKVSIPIAEIETQIQASQVVLADISTDNPNIWFELGYAIASRREVALVCSKERNSHFPFDIQHRSIIIYETESTSDFNTLCSRITARLKALREKEDKLGKIASIDIVTKVEGLAPHEFATLVTVAQQMDDPGEGIATGDVRQAMVKAGFTHIATTLAVANLVEHGMLETFEAEDFNGRPFKCHRVTQEGMRWLLQNQDRIVLKSKPPEVEFPQGIPF